MKEIFSFFLTGIICFLNENSMTNPFEVFETYSEKIRGTRVVTHGRTSWTQLWNQTAKRKRYWPLKCSGPFAACLPLPSTTSLIRFDVLFCRKSSEKRSPPDELRFHRRINSGKSPKGRPREQKTRDKNVNKNAGPSKSIINSLGDMSVFRMTDRSAIRNTQLRQIHRLDTRTKIFTFRRGLTV